MRPVFFQNNASPGFSSAVRGVFAVAAFFFACAPLHNPLSPQPALSLAYTLSIAAMHEDSVSVSVAVNGASPAPRFILPFVYADNPIDSFTGPLVNGFSVVDKEGTQVSFEMSQEYVGPVVSTIAGISGRFTYPLVFSYSIDMGAVFPDSAYGRLSLAFLDSSAGFLPGSHLFMVPFEASLVDIWRTTREITLEIQAGAAVEITGVPSALTAYRNAYELIFVQLSLGAEALAQGGGGGQDFIMYGFPGAERSPAVMIDSLAASFSAILDEIVPLYGRLRDGAYPVVFHRIAGGQEGTHSFVCRYPHRDVDSTNGMVIAHEAIHHRLGIRCGDRDDAWWKEGTTNYLGYATAARLGLATKQRVFDVFVKSLALNAGEQGHAPSEEYLRTYLYTKPLYNLAYSKGGQIAMLMDRAVRRASGNTVRLDEATAHLCALYDGEAFGRDDLTGHFRSYGGCDITDILNRYADTSDSIPVAVLKEAFLELDSLGTFGTGAVDTAPATAKERTATLPDGIGPQANPHFVFY